MTEPGSPQIRFEEGQQGFIGDKDSRPNFIGNERNNIFSEHGLGNERYMNTCRQCNEYLGPRASSVRTKEHEPDKFDDKHWEWDDYLAHFMSVARWNNWSETDMASQLAMSFQRSAQTVLGNITELEVRDFGYLKAGTHFQTPPTLGYHGFRVIICGRTATSDMLNLELFRYIC